MYTLIRTIAFALEKAPYQTSTLGVRKGNVVQEILKMEYVELPAVVTPFN